MRNLCVNRGGKRQEWREKYEIQKQVDEPPSQRGTPAEYTKQVLNARMMMHKRIWPATGQAGNDLVET